MHLFLLLPNIMTQRFRRFVGPIHNYHGFATRGLTAMMRLGFSVYTAARTVRPAVQSVLLITNAADPAVENSTRRWTHSAHSWQVQHLAEGEPGKSSFSLWSPAS